MIKHDHARRSPPRPATGAPVQTIFKLKRRARLRLAPASDAAHAQAHALRQAACDSAATALLRLGSGVQGLTEAEAAAASLRHGPNAPVLEAPASMSRRLWQCYANPFNVLLTALALLSACSDDAAGASAIGAMVLLSTVLRFVQEGRAGAAAAKLKAMLTPRCRVIRRTENSPGGPRQLPVHALVPGDLVVLAAGDIVPADCRLLAATALLVNQSALTGEALPAEKSAQPVSTADADPLQLSNLVFTGSSVVSGAATALVVHTGAKTYFGAISGRVSANRTDASAFEQGVNSVSWLLIRFALVMAPLVFVVNGLTKNDWTEAFLFALSVAVGLTPEMLPMIVTSTLARGAVALSRKQVVVKRLDAIQNLGAMDVLCTDKTGTLTEDHIALARHVGIDGAASDAVLRHAFLNSHFQTGLNNLLDRAVLESAAAAGLDALAPRWKKLDELPFDFTRRRMSVLLDDGDGGRLLVCKGAAEEVLAACTRVRAGTADGDDLALDTAARTRALALMASLNGEGLRLVAVACRELHSDRCIASDESDMTLLGFLAFLDPPKASTQPALRAWRGWASPSRCSRATTPSSPPRSAATSACPSLPY
jgi:Mg2+-importing ATPase